MSRDRPATGSAAGDDRFGRALIVSVQTRAVDGKVNEALRKVLAAVLSVRPWDLVLCQGARGRDKVLKLRKSAPATAALLDSLF